MERPVEAVSKSATLVDVLQFRARVHADRPAYTFLVDGETTAVTISYGELDQKARAIAAYLHDAGATDSRALLLYPSGLDYIIAFFGCLYARVVPVPAYPPRKNGTLDRIEAIVSNAEASHILGTANILSDLVRRFAAHPELSAKHSIATDALDLSAPPAWSPLVISTDTLATLQYTSGSTGLPKGVMVSHANMLCNQRLMQKAFQLDESDLLFGWLPLYHDMGLIGNVLHSMYAGVHCVFMAPVMFLQKPIRWLQAVSRYGATISGGPNFGYDLCNRKILPQQRQDLDLGSWNLAVNGAEPVRAATLDLFSETFAANGFKRTAFLPCYGLAEATLFVAGGPKSDEARTNRVDADALASNKIEPATDASGEVVTLVSSGQTWSDQRLQIVNPDTLEPCPSGVVGEIVVSGGSITQGYWANPDETDSAFLKHAAASGIGSPNETVLRTGDLGFIQDGELFVTGRLKDLIIIRGRNHYPQDIESTVAGAHESLRRGGGAAFSIEIDDEEKLAVVHEVERTAIRGLDEDGIVAAIRKAVSEKHELFAHTIVLLKPGGLPRTTSGKIQRRRSRAKLMSGDLAEVGRSTSTNDPVPAKSGETGQVVLTEHESLTHDDLLALAPVKRAPRCTAHLRGLIARSRKVPTVDIDIHTPVSAFGLDSLDMTELKVSIENDLKLVAPSMEVIQDMSISQLAHELATQITRSAQGNAAASAIDNGAVSNGSVNGRSNGHPGGGNGSESGASSGGVRADLFDKCDTDGGYFGKYRLARDKYFTQPVLDGKIGARMGFEGKEVIVWSVNNYLGLARHPHIHDRAKRALEDHGTWAPMGSRLLTGNTRSHMALEARLARYLGHESSIVFNFGYMGVIGTINALVAETDTVIIDSLSHACIVDGAMLASRGKQFRVFRHNDMESLEGQLRAARANDKGGILVVTEGLFGMTGDLAPLPEICELKEQYGARLFIDDAHGFGVMGTTGAGTAEHLGVQEKVDVYFGTFAKSFAAIGGVTAADERVVEYIRYNARPNIFAKSLPMVYIDAVDAALDLVEQGDERRDKVWHIARRLQNGLRDLGLEVGSTSPITPVYIPMGDEETAVEAMRLMRSEYGVFVSAVTYPVVPRGVVLFRMTATAAHTDEDVDHTIEAFRKLTEQLRLEKTAQPTAQPTSER